MAAPACMTEGHGPATFIGTFLETGDAVRLCDECVPNFCAAVFERMTGVDMTPALYLASEEGQANPDGPAGSPGEVAYPPDMEPKGNTGSEAPPAAPHDADPTAEHDGIEDPAHRGHTSNGSIAPQEATASVGDRPPDEGPEIEEAGPQV